MALYVSHSIFHLARLLYVRPETFGPYYVYRKCYDRTTIYKETDLQRVLRGHHFKGLVICIT